MMLTKRIVCDSCSENYFRLQTFLTYPEHVRYHEKIKLIRHIENQHIEQYGKAHAEDIMCAVKSVAQMETFEGEYTLTDLVMKAGLRLRHVRSILQTRC